MNVHKLFSVEWLVDESDTIAIVRFDSEEGFDNPRVAPLLGERQVQTYQSHRDEPEALADLL